MKVLALLLVLSVACSEGARILSLLTMPSRSHGILMERLVKELASKGHQVTYITGSTQMTKSIPNVTVVFVPGVEEALMPATVDKDKPWDMFSMSGMSIWFMFFFTLSGTKVCDFVLQQPGVQAIINSNEEFDLILAEVFLDESIIAGLSYRFKAPVVGVMPFMPNIWGNYLTGNPAVSSYVPDPNLGWSTKMTFGQRMYNLIYTTAWDLFHPYVYLQWQDAILKKYFGADSPDIRDILRNTSLVLVNHHHALGFPRPYLPNMVEIAGMHINPVKPLPADIKKYLDDSKKGAILFSMGSNLKSADISPEKIESILKAFSRLPFNILWKFEADLPNLPKNVKIDKWLPQSDILAHPNLKLFITHGGLLSTTEAVDRGVPVLGIPIFGDQPLNMKHTENAGLGRTLKFPELNEENLYSAILEVATNPSYAAAAKLRSKVFQDNMNTPLERATWWIEYVIRHDGAPHLRSAAQYLPFYELHQIDVLAVLGLAGLVISYITIFLLRAIFRRLCTKKQQSKSRSKSKKNN